MALTISQMFAASYEAVEKKAAADQWSENFGTTIDETLDYRRNPGAVVHTTDLQGLTMSKTEILTAASYASASISVPVVWSEEDEMKNPTENAKVDLVDTLSNNAFASHDDLLEATLLTGSNGLIGFDTMYSETGVNTIGGIPADVETWWKNKFDEYTDETDIEESFTSVYNQCSKGSGSPMAPKGIVSDATTQAVFEGTQQANQRWVDTDDLKAGFKTLAFKTARYIFSQHVPAARESAYFWNPKSLRVKVSRSHYRKKGPTQQMDNAQGYRFFIYTGVQLVTDNRSRLGVAFS